MRKFLAIVNAFWQRGLTYRFTVLAYRLGELLEVLVLIFMWSAIYQGTASIRGFSLNEMITYVLIGNLFQVMIRNFAASIVAADINEGRLSEKLLRPMSYFWYTFAREVGRSSLPSLMSIVTQLLLITFFLDRIVLNFDPRYLGVMALMLIFAFITEFLIAYLIGLIAFWTDEVDGLYTTIGRVQKFFSGGYFPLQLLPGSLGYFATFLPFAYSFYFPAQIYLKKIPLSAALGGVATQIIWIALLALIARFVWNKGLKRYEATGI